MEASTVKIDHLKARELYRQYQKHRHWSQPLDQEIMRAYHKLAQGKLVIMALESVKAAGLKSDGQDSGFPKLGLCRADATTCTVHMSERGGCTMAADSTPIWSNRAPGRSRIVWPDGSFPREEIRGGRGDRKMWRGTALVPTPPLHLRPKRGLENYHVLWEADWTKVTPYDPMLLRRIGNADLWVVVAMWELTAVERAALSTRL